jgi:itaconate CoA-transferase
MSTLLAGGEANKMARMLPPVTVSGREAAMNAVPALGQRTDAIRAEFGGR